MRPACLVFGLAVALGLGATPGAVAAGFSLRFHGHGAGDIDRVKIPIDDPATAAPGPLADVGAADFTLEFWMKATAADNPAPAVSCGANINWISGNIVFDRDRFNQDRKFGLSIAGGRIVFGVSGDGTGDRTICGTSSVLDGQWHHVAVQRRRADGRLWLHVDGVLQAQADGPDGDVSYPDDGVPGNFCGGPCTNSDPFLVIGAEKHDAGPGYPSYRGWLDEVRLSPILRYGGDFARPSQPFAADPATVALYHLDEGAGDLVTDSSGAPGGPSHGVRRLGGAPAGPEWSTDTPFTAPSVFAGGVFVAAGNLDGAGAAEIITGAGESGGPHVRTFRADGSGFGVSFMAYHPAFGGGVRVAACDFDGDGRAEIATAPGAGGGPHVRVWRVSPFGEVAGFFAYAPAFAGGVFVACGDVDGVGGPALFTGADAGGGPHVRVFKVSGTTVTPFLELLPFPAAFPGGVRVAAGDVDGSGRAAIVVAAGPGGGPHVRVLLYAADGSLGELASFYAYAPGFTGGVYVGTGPVLGGGPAQVLTGPGPGGGPHVRAFMGTGSGAGIGFFAYAPAFSGGVRVGAGPIPGTILVAPGPGGGPHVRVLDGSGAPAGVDLLAY